MFCFLLQSEDKKYKPTWNVEGCLVALESIITKNYIPDSTRDTLKAFMQRQVTVDACKVNNQLCSIY